MATPRSTHVFKRGNHLTLGQEVQPALQVRSLRWTRTFRGIASGSPGGSSIRTTLSPPGGGESLVGRALRPRDRLALEVSWSQPILRLIRELLDWLATEHVANGWSRKHMIRLHGHFGGLPAIVESRGKRRRTDRSSQHPALAQHAPSLVRRDDSRPSPLGRGAAVQRAGWPAGLSSPAGGPVEPRGWGHRAPYWTDHGQGSLPTRCTTRRVEACLPYHPPLSIFDAPGSTADLHVSRSRTATPFRRS